MTGFTPEQAAVLRSLRGSWAEEKFVVIGATAIGCHLDFRWRKTRDLDLSIAAGIEECRKALERIPGWIRHERIEHEWTAPGNVRVDVIPANRTALESGRIDWPGGSTMSAVGLRAAFADNVRREVGDGLFVRVASATAITILKMAASLDRSDRDRDLSDLAYLMQEIVGVDDAERWSDPVLDLDLDYESVSPFVLGRRVAAIADAGEKAVVGRFLARLEDPSDRTASLARMVSRGPREWREGDVATARLVAFRRGFAS
jgi:predicted nucleotidyltransferase